MILDPEHEQMTRTALERLQLKRLRHKLKEVYEKVPFYRRTFDDRRFKPDELRNLHDLRKLPFTTKLDFRDNYPYGLMATPLEHVVRVHASSGTTGKPIITGYTRKDVNIWSQIMARALATAGVTDGDIVQNAHGYGLFTGGLGFHYGAEYLGAMVVPTGAGNTKRQVLLMQDLGTTVLACTPSYALIIGETGGAEPWSEGMREDIEEKLGIKAMNMYGLTEITGPGIAIECPYQRGSHLAEDHFLAEIIDPETGEQLPYGEKGELVITNLSKEAQPVIRFRTKDITSLNPEPCPCGRTLVRVSRITGRTDDMLVVRGVNVFPSQIESVLLTVEGVEPHYLIVVDRKHAFSSDELEIWVEVTEGVFSDEMQKMISLEKRLRLEIESVLGISVRIKLVEPKTITRSEGKAIRVVDRSEL
jgi:phenylacetate-CoA ligase